LEDKLEELEEELLKMKINKSKDAREDGDN